MKTSDQVNEIAKAMATAQGEIKPAIKESLNPHFKAKFCSLTSIWDAIRDPLSRNGISVLQDAQSSVDAVTITTRLIHSSGQWLEFGPLSIPLTKKDAHGIGSAITYAKRYSLASAVGVVSDEDDDGNSACKAEDKKTEDNKPEQKISYHQIKVINEILDKDPELKQRITSRYASVSEIPADVFDTVWKFLIKETTKKNEAKDQEEQVNFKQ